MLKKIRWIVKRHPFLYLTRFRLLSKNADVSEIDSFTYNGVNEKTEIPTYFTEINEIIFQFGKPKSDFELITHLSTWLYEHIKGGPGLSEPSDRALKIMLSGKGGVCSDMAQSFNNFCVLNDIKVREWGTTRAPFDKGFGGHSFNEVYCEEFGKWFLIDVYNCILFYNKDNNLPLSVVELYKALQIKEEVNYKSFNPKRILTEGTVVRNFLHPHTVPFLIYNYSNKTYDTYLKRYRSFLPIFIIHFWLYLTRRSYYYLFPLNDYKEIFA